MTELRATANLQDEFNRVLMQNTPGEAVVVSRRTMCTALQRLLRNEIQVSDLVKWANLIEAYDQIVYERGFEKVIANTVFALSSPEINGSLDSACCRALLDGLNS